MARLSEAQMEHPRFMEFSEKANNALVRLVKDADLDKEDLMRLESQANRVVDDLTTLLMRLDRIKNG